MTRWTILVALLLPTWVSASESGEVGCFDREHVELRYELFVHSINGAPPKARPPVFAHSVPGRSIQKIEIGSLAAGDQGAGRRVPIVRVSLGPADLAKIRELETKAAKYATDAADAHAALSFTAHGQLLAWGRPTGLDALLLPSRGDGEPLVQIPPILQRDLGKWVRWELRCPAEQIPTRVSESIGRLLSKEDWDSSVITSDLHVLMGFEEPESGLSVFESDGSSNTVYYFRRLGIEWTTLTDPNGKSRTTFHRGRQFD